MFGSIPYNRDKFAVLMKGPGSNLHFQMFSHILHNPPSLLLKTQRLASACTSESRTKDVVRFSISVSVLLPNIYTCRHTYTYTNDTRNFGRSKMTSFITVSRGEKQASCLDLRMENSCTHSASPPAPDLTCENPGQPEEEFLWSLSKELLGQSC